MSQLINIKADCPYFSNQIMVSLEQASEAIIKIQDDYLQQYGSGSRTPEAKLNITLSVINPQLF